MATKTKKISVNAFDKAAKAVGDAITDVEWNGLTISVRRAIPLRDMLMFVNDIYKSCFSDSGEYMPEIKDFAIRSCVIAYYTNLSLPENTEKKYEMMYATDVFDAVFEHISKKQFDEMVCAANEKMKQVTDAKVEMMTKQMSDLYATLDGLQANLGDVFGDINTSDLKGVLSALSTGVLDENKLVDAVVNKKYGSAKKN